jgi:hypothetical protein
MDSDINPDIIFETFCSDWYKIDKLKDRNVIFMWKQFIKSLDLGIECVKASQIPDGDEYRIIDEKKWLIAKIKYGF